MRQFVAPFLPDSKGRLRLQGKDHRYLSTVLRLRQGDVLPVRFPDGSLVNMEVWEIGNKFIELRLSDREETTERGVSALEIDREEAGDEIWLFQFVAKAQKMDLIIRQATEVGVSYIVPVQSAFSVQVDSADRKERWRRIVREARQQSGSPRDTQVLSPCSLEKALQTWEEMAPRGKGFVLYEEVGGSKTFHQGIVSYLKDGAEDKRQCALVAGCEGGISRVELALLESKGFIPIHFRTNILRAETAALYGLAVLQNLLTEYDTWQLKESIY